jgi:iron complex transport system substrate-binding protein
MRLLQMLVLALVLVLAGCQRNVTVGGVPREKEFINIISLSPSATEIALNNGLTQKLKGRTQSCDFPMTASRVPVIASLKPDYERIAEITPDLVIFDSQLYGPDELKKIEGIGATTFAFKANTLDEFITELFTFGALTGVETSISSYVDRIMQQKSTSLGDPINPKPKVAVMLPGVGFEHMIAGTDGFVADIVRTSGGEPVGPKSDKFERLNAESLVSQNPDIIVLGLPEDDLAEADKMARAVLNDPRLASIAAIRGKRITPLNTDIVVRRGGRVDRFIENLHKKLSTLMENPAR